MLVSVALRTSDDQAPYVAYVIGSHDVLAWRRPGRMYRHFCIDIGCLMERTKRATVDLQEFG